MRTLPIDYAIFKSELKGLQSNQKIRVSVQSALNQARYLEVVDDASLTQLVHRVANSKGLPLDDSETAQAAELLKQQLHTA